MFAHFCVLWSYFYIFTTLVEARTRFSCTWTCNTSKYLCTVLSSFFRAPFPYGPIGLYFLPSYWPPHPAFHPSFFHLNVSQGDLGRAHLLSILSTSIPSETSEAPFLSQNSPLSSLLALSITQTISFPFPLLFFPFSLCCGLSLLSSVLIMAEPFFILPIIFPPDLFQPRGKSPSFPVNNTSSLMPPPLKGTTVTAAKQ